MTELSLQSDPGKKQILVVDDDPSVREMLVRVLQEDDYQAWGAADGSAALEIAASQPIDLVLLDLGLPGRNGWETFMDLIRETPSLAIIIITAKSNQQRFAESVAADALFEKPLDFPELLRTIDHLLSKASAKTSS